MPEGQQGQGDALGHKARPRDQQRRLSACVLMEHARRAFADGKKD